MRGRFGHGLVAATLAIAAAGSVPTGAAAGKARRRRRTARSAAFREQMAAFLFRAEQAQ